MTTDKLLFYLTIPVVLAFSSCTDHTGSTGSSAGVSKDATHEELPADIVEMNTEQIKAANITLGKFESRQLGSNMNATGLVTVPPDHKATVCAPMGGFVRSVDLIPGSLVQKGQVLAVLENQDFIDLQQKYLESRSRLDYAAAEFKRHSELYKEEVYSEKNLQQVTADYRSLKAEVNGLEQKLQLIGIDPAQLHEDDISRTVGVVSPITGYLISVNVNLGKFVTPTDVMFEIVNSDKLLLDLTLFEKDANRVVPGQSISFTINDEAEKHRAVIYEVGRSVNSDKTVRVYATIIQPCRNLLPGMFVQASLESGDKEMISLPSKAIVNFEDKDYIFIFEREKMENGKRVTEYKMVGITKGITENGFTQVILPQGFNTLNAQVVVEGAYNLLAAKKNAGDMAC